MAGQLVKRGDRTWTVRVFVERDGKGKRKYHNKTIHGTKKDAERALNALLVQRDKGLPMGPVGTLSSYADEWLATKRNVKPRTLHDYRDTFNRWVRPTVGNVRLSSLNGGHVRSMMAKLQEHGLSPRSVRKAREVLRNILKQAVVDGLIPVNPARQEYVESALPPAAETERETVPASKVKAFLAAAAQDRFHAYWVLLLFTGLRPSEALALRWEDVEDNVVTVSRKLVDVRALPLMFDSPKTRRSRRRVVLPQAAVDALREHKKRQAAEQLKAGPAWQGQGLIFCDEVGQPLRQDRTRRSFKALVEAAKLPAMRIYDLRHSTATLLLEMGEDLKIVSDVLGHSTITLTANTYAHITRGMQERAAARLDTLTGTG